MKAKNGGNCKKGEGNGGKEGKNWGNEGGEKGEREFVSHFRESDREGGLVSFPHPHFSGIAGLQEGSRPL